MLRILYTSDISLELLSAFSTDCSPDIEIQVDNIQEYHRSLEPPSWISLIAEPNAWLNIFGLSVSIYLGSFLNAAGKDTWKNCAELLARARPNRNTISDLGKSLSKLKRDSSPNTHIEIAVPIPNEYFSTRLILSGNTPELISFQIALFVHHLNTLVSILDSNGTSDAGCIGGYFLSIRDDGAMEIRWKVDVTFEEKLIVLHVKPQVNE